MYVDVPADVVVEPGHLPRHDSGERDVVVQGQPFVIVGGQLIHDSLFESGRVLARRRHAAVSCRRTMEDLRPAIGRARLVVFGITADAIAGGVAKRDDNAAGNVSQRRGFRSELATGHDIPTRRKVGVGGCFRSSCRLHLVRQELVRADLRIANDAAANGKCRGIDQGGGVLEVADEFGSRRAAVSEWHGFTKGRGVCRVTPFYLAQCLRPGRWRVLTDMAVLPEVTGIDQGQQPKLICGIDPLCRHGSRGQRKQIGRDSRGRLARFAASPTTAAAAPSGDCDIRIRSQFKDL